MITRETIAAMSRAYREIEAGEKLLAEVKTELEKDTESIDFNGNPRNTAKRCQLGWPMNDTTRACYQVEPMIALSVIVAHLADQRARLEKLNEVAKLESRA